MNRASPVELRKALEAANIFVKAGILFVPIPIVAEDDKKILGQLLAEQLDLIVREE